MTSTDYYDRNGDRLARRYDALDPRQLHRAWAPLLAGRRHGLACDIGAGSGRDARWLADMGWQVLAVEPSATMRRRGEKASVGAAITWVDDSLPQLRRLRRSARRCDLVLLSAVWQHLAAAQRPPALRALCALLCPGGRLVITLRHGRNSAENRERGFHPVSAPELAALTREQGLRELLRATQVDAERDDLEWETLVFA